MVSASQGLEIRASVSDVTDIPKAMISQGFAKLSAEHPSLGLRVGSPTSPQTKCSLASASPDDWDLGIPGESGFGGVGGCGMLSFMAFLSFLG